MTEFRLPQELKLTSGNVAENFRKWRRQLEIYLEATGSKEKSAKTQTAIILNCAGPQALDVYDQFIFSEEDNTDDPSLILDKFHEYCQPRKNEVLESFRFWNTKIIQPFHSFLTDLRTKADKCNFKDKERMIRDKIVFSVDPNLQEKLISHSDLTLKMAVEICQSYEQTKSHLQEMQFHHMNTHTKPEECQVQIDKVNTNYHKQNHDITSGNMIINCHYCGRNHEKEKEKCFAWGKICSNCRGRNHFAVKCKRIRNVNLTKEESDSKHKEWLNVVTTNKQRMTALLLINGMNVRFQVDTGADVNIICQKYVRREQCFLTKQKLVMWNGTEMIPKGEATLITENPKTKEVKEIKFTVVDNKFACLLSLNTSKELKIITVNEQNFIAKVSSENCLSISNSYPQSVGDLGTAKLTIDPNVKPVILPCRKIPLALHDKVKNEIELLLQRGILKKVEEPTPWVSQMVTVTKRDGGLRVCIDPQPLNRALCRQHYHLPTFDDILPKLQNAKVFSKLDIKEAFWHVKLDEESSKLTTMITPLGYRVRWTRLPFGLKVSSEIFQKHLAEALEGLTGCINVTDDIVITGRGKTIEEANMDHDMNMKKLEECCQQKNIKQNNEKSSIKQKEITFLGHKISEKGIEPTHEKIKAILNTTPPNDISGV